MKRIYLILITGIVILIGCKTTNKTTETKQSAAEALLEKTINAHGGNLYNSAHYQFNFRGNTYTFKNSDNDYEYSVLKRKDGKEIYDHMSNQEFTRTIDGNSISLDDKEKTRYGGSLNSVIYFATLPHKLKDPSVNLSIREEVSIKGQDYQVLEVYFDEEGGGQDHEDVYYYWINKKSNLIDYLAYNFIVNKGGVRFRAAYNPRRVEGIIFQDYVNYKADVGTPLEKLPALYENGKLTELSKIETEEVKAIK